MMLTSTRGPINRAPDLLQTKTHFEILDGLRGVAAVAVVIFHFMEFAVPDYTNSFIAHAYLAVDFFFCLSGFVIAYAYDQRLEKIGVIQFLKLRLIRLQPLVVIGSVIGLLAFVFDPFNNLYAIHGVGETVMMFVTSCLMIPYAVVPERYNNLFHLNPPSWSLLWEYIANILYALVLFKFRNKILWCCTIIAALVLCFTARHYTYLGVGWGVDSFAGGAARICYSFLAGMLIYRSNWIIKNAFGFLSMSVLLVIAFLVPYIKEINWVTDPLIVIFYFPLLVALGAGAGLNARLRSICRFSGEISYPLYMVHYPFLWLFLSYIEVKKPTIGQMTIMIPVGVMLLIGFAWLVMKYLDIPVRNYLKDRMKNSLS